MLIKLKYLLLLILLLILTGCGATFRKELVAGPASQPVEVDRQYSVNLVIDTEYISSTDSYESKMPGIFKKTVERAFKESGFFNKVVVNQESVATDFRAKVTISGIKQNGFEQILLLTYGTIPFYSDEGNYDLNLVMERYNGDIVMTATEHEETRTWFHLIFLLPFWGEDEPLLSEDIAYDLTRAALGKVKLSPNSATKSEFY